MVLWSELLLCLNPKVVPIPIMSVSDLNVSPIPHSYPQSIPLLKKWPQGETHVPMVSGLP